MRRIPIAVLLLAVLTNAQNPSTKNGRPGLKDTLQWMHHAFPDSRSLAEFKYGQTRELTFSGSPNAGISQCTVTIVEHWKAEGKPTTRDTIIDLSLIDPESVKWYIDDTLDEGTPGLVLASTNDKKIIVEKLEGEKSKPFLTDRVFISFVGQEYAERFAKAFKNAVTLCGGKPSTF